MFAAVYAALTLKSPECNRRLTSFLMSAVGILYLVAAVCVIALLAVLSQEEAEDLAQLANVTRQMETAKRAAIDGLHRDRNATVAAVAREKEHLRAAKALLAAANQNLTEAQATLQESRDLSRDLAPQLEALELQNEQLDKRLNRCQQQIDDNIEEARRKASVAQTRRLAMEEQIAAMNAAAAATPASTATDAKS